MNLTYRQLAEKINAMPDEWRDGNVTVYDPTIDEAWGVKQIDVAGENVATALDEGHPVLTMDI